MKIDASEAPPIAVPLAAFNRTTSFWGPVTLVAGMASMFVGPVLLAIFGGFEVRIEQVLVAFVALAIAVGVLWVVEPVSYFPILGPASMYQAFLIGNVSTKLLPAVLTAQNRIGAKTGTPKAQLTAVIAICAAAIVHVISLIVVVGIFGTLLVSVLPPALLSTVSTFVVPAILGAFIVQAVLTNLKNYPILIAGAAVGCLVVFGLLDHFPLFSPYVPLFGVVLTVAVTMVIYRNKPQRSDSTELMKSSH
ncbi:hypothetical protein [Arthrobacter sp. MMS18-M83]|uniref:hypothetical protein n=1 Tax=Arthrobacter sp. MMS18-M83 TaxID=2996261 RepID=UPI00227A90C9|nr:hypothetical protein [Arthrobacter sp. MMS18-M83]WAH97769.1 hypothetical protein OW521_02385 [Arthrobacter sp. MMS18-M83]